MCNRLIRGALTECISTGVQTFGPFCTHINKARHLQTISWPRLRCTIVIVIQVSDRDVNETLKPKTRPRLLSFHSKMRLRPSKIFPETETSSFQHETKTFPDFPKPRWDQDLSKVRLQTISWPRVQDQDYITGLRHSDNRHCCKYTIVFMHTL